MVGLVGGHSSLQASPQPQPSPALKIIPSALNFSGQAVNTASSSQAISLTNGGSADIQILDIVTSGIDFSQSNTCGDTLAAGATCAISVTFKPATTGQRLGTLTITASDLAGPHLVPLNGSGQ